jgi:threonine/homoserine/homoserine lactone efflux protein
MLFVVGALVSFIGSIPPGTLNILVLQLGLQNNRKAAFRFSLAVAVVEYPYAWIAVESEEWITRSPLIQANFSLVASIVMVVLGLYGLWSARQPAASSGKFLGEGFKSGLILSLLNPQAIPWWIAVIAYLKAQGWISLNTHFEKHFFILGTALGSLALLILLAVLAQRLSGFFQNSRMLARFPGALLLALGTFALVKYFLFS